MRVIDADRLYQTIIDEIDPISISMDGGEMRGMMRTIIAAEPTVEAVPLDKLCKFLAGIYGAPCQLGEIECYPQCSPDAEGMCLGMRSNDETCWTELLKTEMKGAKQ